MESFKDTHPDYEAYESEHYVVKEVPDGFSSAVEGLVTKNCEEGTVLKNVVNVIRECIPEGPTQNWGWDWLTTDLGEALRAVAKRPLHRPQGARSQLDSTTRFGPFSRGSQRCLKVEILPRCIHTHNTSARFISFRWRPQYLIGSVLSRFWAS